MKQMGAITTLLAIFLRKEVGSYSLPRGILYGRNSPWSTQVYDIGNDYESEFKDLSLPLQFFYTGSTPIERNPSYDLVENIDFEDMGKNLGKAGLTFPVKRAPSGFPTLSKRIHTCAFMRRLGLPIGLCFNGSRNRNSQRPQEGEEKPEQKAYSYLERQWPVHSMLGGGVGR